MLVPLASPLPAALALVTLQLLPTGLNLTRYFGDGGAADAADAADAAPLSESVVLLRLRHVYQAGLDDPALATPCTVDLATLLAPRLAVASAVEVTLDGFREVNAARAAQVQWPEEADTRAGAEADGGGTSGGLLGSVVGSATSVVVSPGEVRTFLLTVA
jgi:hypothetical protein